MTITAILPILNELIDGTAEPAWMLNAGDVGLLGSLDRLSAEKASVVPQGGGASIAAHVDHLRYGLGLLNRWSRGEEPFADADYSQSWEHGTVSEADWARRREALRHEAYQWREAIGLTRDPGSLQITTIVAAVAHLAYHLGAIRQIDRSIRGPAATD